MDRIELLYSRELPGGGSVRIESLSAEGEGEGEGEREGEGNNSTPCRARISVERRTDPQRREGHTPPVIVEAEATTRSVVFSELYEIASDNVAVARGLIQWQTRRRGG